MRFVKGVHIVLLAAFALPSAGCAEFGSIVHEVLEYANEAQALFSALRAAYDFFVTTSGVNLDADTKAKIDQAFSTAAVALNAAVSATQGVDGLSQGDLDKAFADFKVAVQDLIDLLDKAGATQVLARGVGGHRTAVLTKDMRLIRIPVAFQK